MLPISALINNRIFCIHGGLSPEIKSIEQIVLIDRNQEVPEEGGLTDLLWSDPDDIDYFSISPRGAGWLFGSKVTKYFFQINDISLICRAHQLCQEGFKYWFNNAVLSVWSAPNYMLRMNNDGSVVRFKEDLSNEIVIFKPRKCDFDPNIKSQPNNFFL